jgi:hypothetical protein
VALKSHLGQRIEGVEMDSIWRFIVDNQHVLGWLGGGVVVAAGGVWTVAEFLLERKRKPVSAVSGVAAGRDIRGTSITITHTEKSDGGSGP